MITLPQWSINAFMAVIRIVVQCYTIVTLPLYKIIQHPKKVLEKANYVRAKQVDPNNPYSEWIRTGYLPHHPLIDCETVSEAIIKLTQLYDKDRPCAGYRETLEEQVQLDAQGNEMRLDGKLLKKYKLSDYKWLSYGDVDIKSYHLGRGFLLNGFKPKDTVLFFAETRMENLIFTASMSKIGAVVISVFATLDNDSIAYAINETEAQFCYTTYDLLPRMQDICKKCPKLRTIVYVEGPTGGNNNEIPIAKFPDEINVWTIAKLESDSFNSTKQIMFEPLPKEEVMIIGYTSGTTGAPKGIALTGAQMRTAFLAVLPVCERYISKAENHTYIAYLPQAHVLEASLEMMCFLGGCKMGFATPFTLYENAPGLADGVECDLKLLKPTLMAGVPLVLDRMRKQIYHKLKSRTPISTPIFDYLMQYKMYWMERGYDTPIVNTLLCHQVRKQFGGKLEHMVVGSAPLSPDLQALIKASMNIILGQGYGATETCGACMCMDDYDLTYGNVGAPLWDIRAKLVDWEEGGYTVRDKPNPRGELVIGGEGIASGYFKNAALTAESFKVEDGHRYFYTGDIAEVFPDGRFKIIDRKKDLVKLANGEYFSLGKIEAALKNCEYIDNACIFGNAFKDHLVALVTPHEKNFQNIIQQLQLQDLTWSQQCEDERVNKHVYDAILSTGRQMKLHKREIPKVITICSEVWSPDNDILTAAMKLKRRIIQVKYKDQIDKMFELV